MQHLRRSLHFTAEKIFEHGVAVAEEEYRRRKRRRRDRQRPAVAGSVVHRRLFWKNFARFEGLARAGSRCTSRPRLLATTVNNSLPLPHFCQRVNAARRQARSGTLFSSPVVPTSREKKKSMNFIASATKALQVSPPTPLLPLKLISIATPRSTRIMSTWRGRAGREYIQEGAFQSRHSKHGYGVFFAQSDGRQYIVKKVSKSIFELSQELKHEFGTERRLRVHVDENESEHILIYEHFRDDLLSFVSERPSLNLQARRRILREVALAIKALHSKHWIHLDLKPNNILLDWTMNQANEHEIERVVLADLDCALHLQGSKLLNHRMGNVMWRSPEGQAGKGIGKPSEIFSYGLLCLYTISGAEVLHPDFEQLEKDGTEPEFVILYKLLSMFGPAPPELLTHIDDEYWNELLIALSEAVKEQADDSERFEQWNENVIRNMDQKTRAFILRMTQLDPSKRATINEVLDDSWWSQVN